MSPKPAFLRQRVPIMPIVYYAIAIAIAFYGLKCIATHQGVLMDMDTRSRWGRYGHLVSVHSEPAVTTGLGYLCIGIFWVIRPLKQDDDTSLLWYFIRYVLALSILGLTFWLWHVAHNQRLRIT
jgi:hypothetical protein